MSELIDEVRHALDWSFEAGGDIVVPPSAAVRAAAGRRRRRQRVLTVAVAALVCAVAVGVIVASRSERPSVRGSRPASPSSPFESRLFPTDLAGSTIWQVRTTTGPDPAHPVTTTTLTTQIWSVDGQPVVGVQATSLMIIGNDGNDSQPEQPMIPGWPDRATLEHGPDGQLSLYLNDSHAVYRVWTASNHRDDLVALGAHLQPRSGGGVTAEPDALPTGAEATVDETDVVDRPIVAIFNGTTGTQLNQFVIAETTDALDQFDRLIDTPTSTTTVSDHPALVRDRRPQLKLSWHPAAGLKATVTVIGADSERLPVALRVANSVTQLDPAAWQQLFQNQPDTTATLDPSVSTAVGTSTPPNDTAAPTTTPVSPSTTTTTAGQPPRQPQHDYVIQPGDYPLGVAQKFNVTLDALLAINGWRNDQIDSEWPAPGTTIIIPAGGTFAPGWSGDPTHTPVSDNNGAVVGWIDLTNRADQLEIPLPASYTAANPLNPTAIGVQIVRDANGAAVGLFTALGYIPGGLVDATHIDPAIQQQLIDYAIHNIQLATSVPPPTG